MAALKRSLGQKAPAVKGARARKGSKAAPDRRQRALLLPVSGGGRKKELTTNRQQSPRSDAKRLNDAIGVKDLVLSLRFPAQALARRSCTEFEVPAQCAVPRQK